MPIFTAPLLVVIPADESDTPAEVLYVSDLELAIRWRVNGGTWTAQALDQPNELDAAGQPSPDTALRGEFSVSVPRGGKVEIEAWPLRGAQRSKSWPESIGSSDRLEAITIRGVRDKVPFRFSEPFAPEIGGTYWWARVAVVASSPWVRLQIGFQAPVSVNGVLEIPDAHPSTEKLSDEAPVHELEIDTLLPGNDYFFVLTVADAGSTGSSGDWQQFSGPFKTLQRGAAIFFKEIVFTNAGDSGDGGPGAFAFQIREYGSYLPGTTAPPDNVLRDFSFTIQHFNDGEVVDLSPYGTAYLIAPKKVTPESEYIGVHLRGVEHDEWPDLSDVSTTLFNRTVRLNFPRGRFKEDFSNRIEKIYATYKGRGAGQDEFEFYVNVQYSSLYLPAPP
jgi:hypothetical protein